MELHCPFCGDTFRWAKGRQWARLAALEEWVRHAWECSKSVGPWIPEGTRVPWTDTLWQAQRLVAIRDSVMNPGSPYNPYHRLPVCQACRTVARVSARAMFGGGINGFEFQHILPRSQGGTDHPRNLAVLCRRCHVWTFRHGYRGVPNFRQQATLGRFSRRGGRRA